MREQKHGMSTPAFPAGVVVLDNPTTYETGRERALPNAVTWLESTLRRISVGKHMAIAALTLALPMTALITVSVTVLQHQERELHHTIDEAVNLLVPLATLEYDLQRALTDALSAETGEPVPDYGGLTSAIDPPLARYGLRRNCSKLPTGRSTRASGPVEDRSCWARS